MSEKIVQLNEEVIKGQRRGNPQRTAGGRGGEADPGGPVRAQ